MPGASESCPQSCRLAAARAGDRPSCGLQTAGQHKRDRLYLSTRTFVQIDMRRSLLAATALALLVPSSALACLPARGREVGSTSVRGVRAGKLSYWLRRIAPS